MLINLIFTLPLWAKKNILKSYFNIDSAQTLLVKPPVRSNLYLVQATFAKTRVFLKKPTGLGFFGFYWVLLGIFGFYWVFLGFIKNFRKKSQKVVSKIIQ